MLGCSGRTRRGRSTWAIGGSLLLAVTLAACFEGPSVTTTGPDDEQIQAAGGVAAEGDGAEVRRDTLTDRGDGTGADEPKPSAATTERDDAGADDEDGSSDTDDDESSDDASDDGADEEGEDSDDDSSDGDGSDGDGSGGDGPPGGGADASLAATSVAYVNDRRSEAGLGALAGDAELTQMADRWARQMIAEQDLHHNPNLGAQMPAGYSTIGENIAYSSNPAGIDGMWWDSDGHRANILGRSYTHIGVAFVQDDRGTTWAVQVFAG